MFSHWVTADESPLTTTCSRVAPHTYARGHTHTHANTYCTVGATPFHIEYLTRQIVENADISSHPMSISSTSWMRENTRFHFVKMIQNDNLGQSHWWYTAGVSKMADRSSCAEQVKVSCGPVINSCWISYVHRDPVFFFFLPHIDRRQMNKEGWWTDHT